MKLDEFVEALCNCADAHDLSVYSEGGYWYLATDRDGHKVTPAELGINLAVEGGEYVRIVSDALSRTAKITPSDSEADNANVLSVGQTEDGHSGIVIGDVW